MKPRVSEMKLVSFALKEAGIAMVIKTSLIVARRLFKIYEKVRQTLKRYFDS